MSKPTTTTAPYKKSKSGAAAASNGNRHSSIREVIQFSERKFDIKTLPADMQRVYKALAKNFGEEYALLVMFTMRTAVELHVRNVADVVSGLLLSFWLSVGWQYC